MKVIDSSGWIEYFRGSELGKQHATHLVEGEVLVPAIVVYEVYRFVQREIGEEAASRAAARLRQEHTADLDDMLAISAADISRAYGLHMADAIIYATALAYQAQIVTSDVDLGQLPDVVYYPKQEQQSS